MKLVKKEFMNSPREIIKKVKEKAKEFNFIVREVFDMAKEFKEHGVDIIEDFEYYSIMICNPQKAYDSISKSPVRGAVLLPPKQIVIYPKDTKTIVAYIKQEKEDIAEVLPEDKLFQEGLNISCNKIEELINSI